MLYYMDKFYYRVQLTPWSRAVLERSPVVQPLDSFSACYGTRWFITEFTRVLNLYLY
jgi:hypothetical protein